VSYIASVFHLWSVFPPDWKLRNEEPPNSICKVIAKLSSEGPSYAGFAGLYVVFVGLFAKKLTGWDETLSEQCYHYGLIASPKSNHPDADQAYVYVTFVTMSVSILGCWLLTLEGDKLIRHLLQNYLVPVVLEHSEAEIRAPNAMSNFLQEELTAAETDPQRRRRAIMLPFTIAITLGITLLRPWQRL
jgi:hypothetical protein